jgi:hypothetical protein
MNYYILNNGVTHPIAPDEGDSELIESLQTLVEKGGPIPGFPDFRMQVIHYGPSAAVFIILRDWEPMVVHAVAWDREGANAIWTEIERIYLEMTDEYIRYLPNAAAPEKPTELPWVAVFFTPSCLVEKDLQTPLANLGLAMAQAIVEACQEA